MYGEAGYGRNWQPVTNQARRLDPYTRSCTIVACLFAVGLGLIIIIVLSLIPLYISHGSKPAANDVFVLRLLVSGYTLQVRSPADDFNSNAVLDRSNNRQALQAALTSLIQQDAFVAGSLLEIYSSSSRRRRQASTGFDVICDLLITSNRSCVSTICASQFQSSVANLLTGSDQSTSLVRYEQTTNTSSASTIYWFRYQLPAAMRWNMSIVNVDPHSLSSSLASLLAVDQALTEERLNTTVSSTLWPIS